MSLTAESDAKKKLKPITLGLIVIFLALIVLSLVLGILPQYFATQRLNQNIDVLTIDLEPLRSFSYLDLERQKKIFPIHAKAIQINQFDFLPKLPFPERNALDRHRISQLSQTFDQLASQHNLRSTGNSLSVQKIGTQSYEEKVSVDLRLSGQFFDFRNFLISICALPFFDIVENVKIEPVDKTNKRFATKIRLNLNKK